MALSYQEILDRREKRRAQELALATRRPMVPSAKGAAWQVMILQWTIDSIYEEWRASEIAKAQATKEVIKSQRAPSRGRGGRRNPVFEALGLT